MILIIWRILILAVLHAGVLILFPYYPATGPLTVFIIFLVSVGVVIGLSSLFSLLWLSKSVIISSLFDFVMICAASAILLLVTPQTDNISPADKLLKGNYPVKANMEEGWKKFKKAAALDAFDKELKPAIDEVNRGVAVIKKAVVQDVKEKKEDLTRGK